MRASRTHKGLTVRVIAGTNNIIVGIDLAESERKGCLGFSIQRTDVDPEPGEKTPQRYLPNLLRFPTDTTKGPVTTETAPLQKFRWGDYTCDPGKSYRYRVVPRYGTPGKLQKIGANDGVTVEVTTENNALDGAASVFFNRGAAASRAFDLKFPKIKTEAQLVASDEAKVWLSRGLEEALVGFIARAKDATYAIHAAVYEFQKAELLAALNDAVGRGAEVSVVFHAREKNDKDPTKKKNEKAIKSAKATFERTPRDADPQGGIMHNKFIVLLKNDKPIATWTGSTNWTDGAIYGQLNVGHSINDAAIARTYEGYFQLLKKNVDAADSKHEVEKLTPVAPLLPPAPGITPIFSPQTNETMLHLYSSICASAKCVFICAPFAVSPVILGALTPKPGDGTLRFFLLDKEGSLGKGQEVAVIENDPANAISVATTLPSALHDFQATLLEGKESFRHAGIHIHSKVIIANPFSSNPTVITGSANFSRNSTEVNDSNTLIFRGDTAVADIYATEFMRMFEHYHFRASQAHALKHVHGRKTATVTKLALVEDDSWSDHYYEHGSHDELDRMMFAGTLH